MNTRYIGRIVSIPGNDGFAFIGIASTAKSDGTPHEIPTKHDIFLHRDESSSSLRVGMTVEFEIIQDTKRGEGFFRAQGAVECIEMELLPNNEPPIQGFNALAPFGSSSQQVVLAPTEAQRGMKVVPGELVAKVAENQPAPQVARDSTIPPDVDELMQLFLRHLFPTLLQFGTEFRLDGDDTALDANMSEVEASMIELGMSEQAEVTKSEVARFKSLRESLNFMKREGLVRRDAIIPMDYLVDFFCAVPVWYVWMDEVDSKGAMDNSQTPDPQVNKITKWFCDLFPNQIWADVFQMFNRRVRTLKQYKGDIIPPHVLRKIREATSLFDYVVIMTPYHDVAGKDWSDLKWLRSIDPYVVGFKKGIPYFFILARFSDSGTFPLFNELVADTVDFLRTNKTKLRGFNLAARPYWKMTVGANTYEEREELGTHLQKVVDELLKAFDQGHLFDWLRGKRIS